MHADARLSKCRMLLVVDVAACVQCGRDPWTITRVTRTLDIRTPPPDTAASSQPASRLPVWGYTYARTSNSGSTPCCASFCLYSRPVSSCPIMPTNLHLTAAPAMLAMPLSTLAAEPPGILPDPWRFVATHPARSNATCWLLQTQITACERLRRRLPHAGAGQAACHATLATPLPQPPEPAGAAGAAILCPAVPGQFAPFAGA